VLLFNILAYNAFSCLHISISSVNLTLSTHPGDTNISGHKQVISTSSTLGSPIAASVLPSLIETGRHQYTCSHSWFAISCCPLVLHSKVESSELSTLFNQGRGVLAQHRQISVASKGQGRAKVPMYLCPVR